MKITVLVQRIAKALHQVGVREGGVLLVHSSLSALGYVEGGAETVIQGLLAALGTEGTLLMPALSYERVTPRNPVFDVRRTPSNVGAIPEYFRRREGTRRSLHPTHSVCAVGSRTRELLADHSQDSTPCGPHSPFRKLREASGQLLMLGCGLRPNTSMHAIEELAVPPYLFGEPLIYQLRDEKGYVKEKIYRPHSFLGYVQRYDRVAEVLSHPLLCRGQVLAATVYLLDVPALWDAVLIKLRQDPLYFVDDVREFGMDEA
ncbi:MAG: AAC(3) family N-acetyltransferase [Anaerolineae bacterium]|nr:AAC(3) family N-acetyltransferase [Anaerolineae bacterium]